MVWWICLNHVSILYLFFNITKIDICYPERQFSEQVLGSAKIANILNHLGIQLFKYVYCCMICSIHKAKSNLSFKFWFRIKWTQEILHGSLVSIILFPYECHVLSVVVVHNSFGEEVLDSVVVLKHSEFQKYFITSIQF